MIRACGTRLAKAAAGLLLLLILVLPAAAVEIREVVSAKGIRAWFVEDDTVPIVTLRFAFKGGSAQDPAGQSGLANLMTSLFDEGAGELDSAAFQARLDDSGAEMGFSESRDAIYGTMRTLAESRDEAFSLLALAVNHPRFDRAPFERIRNQVLSGIKAGARDPNTLAQERWRKALYGDHPYALDDSGTEASLAAIAPADLKRFHARQFARSNLVVAAVGAIDEATLKAKLDAVFGGLPERPELTPVADLAPKLGQEVRVPFDLPQASLALAYPGVPRADPRFFAANLMVEILGGNGLSSRLFDEVREKRGLAYGVDASLANFDHLSMLVISTATNAARADETLAVIRDTVKRMAAEGPTEAELAAVKRYVIGAYAINALDSSSSIASTLVELQMENLGIDYLDRRTGLIGAVTLDQVRQAARELLTAEPAVLVVGGKAP